MTSTEYTDLKEIFGFLPFWPDLVVIYMTPLAAWLPQRAAADAPFRIWIDSISLGLISFNLDWDTTPDVDDAPEELSIGTPSRIIRGCKEDVIVTGPLIWICDPAPGSPELLVTRKPDALPAIPSIKPVSADLEIWLPSTFDAVSPNLSLSSLNPKAVTTTSPNSVISSSNSIEITDIFPILTSLLL